MSRLNWGIKETFFKSERWTAFVIRKRKVIALCGHKHRSIEKAAECAAVMISTERERRNG